MIKQLIILIFAFTLFADNVCIVPQSQADLKVYVTTIKSHADWYIYKSPVSSIKEGYWKFVKYKSQADIKICFVAKSQADIIIYYIEKSQAGKK